MKIVDPQQASRKFVLLANTYPWIGGADHAAFERARVSLKLSVLLYGKLTIPGSFTLEDSFLRQLVLSNLDFVRSGSLCLDLRSTCDSYRSLANARFGRDAAKFLRTADILDESCAEVLTFDPAATSDAYVAAMRQVLISLAGSASRPEERRILEQRAHELETVQGFLTLARAEELGSATSLAGRIRHSARLLYCVVGARPVNAEAQVPAQLLEQASAGRLFPVRLAEMDQLFVAHQAVLEFFEIRADAIDRLIPLDIIELREQPSFRRFLLELEHAVRKSEENVIRGAIPDQTTLKEATAAAKAVHDAVYAACRKERDREIISRKILHAIDEAGGAAMPLFTTAREVIAWAGRRAAKVSGADWLDFSIAPIEAYVSRFQASLRAKK